MESLESIGHSLCCSIHNIYAANYEDLRSLYCRDARGVIVCYGSCVCGGVCMCVIEWYIFNQVQYNSQRHDLMWNPDGDLDVTNRESFEHVVKWVEEARREAEPSCVVAIVGTKGQLQMACCCYCCWYSESHSVNSLAYSTLIDFALISPSCSYWQWILSPNQKTTKDKFKPKKGKN